MNGVELVFFQLLRLMLGQRMVDTRGLQSNRKVSSERAEDERHTTT
jgi:hypothetical protein